MSFETTKGNGPVRWEKQTRTVFMDVGNRRWKYKPVRYMHKKSRTVVCKQPYSMSGYVNVRCLLEARTVFQREVPTSWNGNTVRCTGHVDGKNGKKYPVRY